MDKRTESRLKRKHLRLRTAIFLRRNGLYAALALCLAVIGTAAAVVFFGGNEGGNGGGTPAERDYDQHLAEVTQAAHEPSPTPGGIVLPGYKNTPVPKTPLPELMPDITPAPSATPSVSAEPVTLTSPVNGEIIKEFAMDCLIYSKTLNQWMTHPGVDIAAPIGAEVRAVAAGTVTRVYKDDMLGVTVVIEHENGMRTVYSCLKDEVTAAEGQKVNSRQLIGYVGDTAISECADTAHLHFELYVSGSLADPQKYITFVSGH